METTQRQREDANRQGKRATVCVLGKTRHVRQREWFNENKKVINDSRVFRCDWLLDMSLQGIRLNRTECVMLSISSIFCTLSSQFRRRNTRHGMHCNSLNIVNIRLACVPRLSKHIGLHKCVPCDTSQQTRKLPTRQSTTKLQSKTDEAFVSLSPSAVACDSVCSQRVCTGIASYTDPLRFQG